jgi:hypothetical protein
MFCVSELQSQKTDLLDKAGICHAWSSMLVVVFLRAAISSLSAESIFWPRLELASLHDQRLIESFRSESVVGGELGVLNPNQSSRAISRASL